MMSRTEGVQNASQAKIGARGTRVSYGSSAVGCRAGPFRTTHWVLAIRCRAAPSRLALHTAHRYPSPPRGRSAAPALPPLPDAMASHAVRFSPLLSTARPTPRRAAARRGPAPAFLVVRCSSAGTPSAVQALKVRVTPKSHPHCVGF
jgi:hypothetical protein